MMTLDSVPFTFRVSSAFIVSLTISIFLHTSVIKKEEGKKIFPPLGLLYFSSTLTLLLVSVLSTSSVGISYPYSLSFYPIPTCKGRTSQSSLSRYHQHRKLPRVSRCPFPLHLNLRILRDGKVYSYRNTR